MSRFALDLSQINRDNAGVNHYLRGLLKGLSKHPEHEYLLYARRPETLEFSLPENFQWIVLPSVPKFLGGGFAWYWKLARDLRRRKADGLIEVTMNSSCLFYSRTLMIMHDLAPITMPENSDQGTRRTFKLFTLIAKYKAWKLAAISQSTRDQIREFFGQPARNIAIIGVGLNEWTHTEVTEADRTRVREKYSLPEKFIFTLATLQPRKNHIRMLTAFAQVAADQPDLHYILGGGKGWDYENILQTITDLGISDRVKFLDFVDENDMAPLFDSAQAFMYVSLEEGFGLPIIEARARSLPVLASNIKVFREIKPDGSLRYVDPTNVAAISRGIIEVISLPHKQPEPSFFEDYSWDKVADRLLAELML